MSIYWKKFNDNLWICFVYWDDLTRWSRDPHQGFLSCYHAIMLSVAEPVIHFLAILRPGVLNFVTDKGSVVQGSLRRFGKETIWYS